MQIDISPVPQGIETIAPPFFQSVHLARGVLGKVRENRLAREAALTLEQVQFRTPDDATLRAAERAQRRRRDQFFLAPEPC